MTKYSFFISVVVLFIISCSDEKVLIPKQRMYPQINFPKRNYVNFDESYCKFTFTYPDYLLVQKDSFYFEGKPKDECWFNLNNKELNSTWHCSYYPITKANSFDELVNDAYTITGKHNVKANARKESMIKSKNGVSGILFEVDGPVASPIQFYLSDSTKHFFRASLYLNAKVNPDSTAPVYKFLVTDMEKLIEDFKWKK